MSFVKVRNTRAGSRAFSQAAKKRAARNRGGGRRQTVAGRFDYLKLGQTPIWLRIQDQKYSYKTWDRDAQEVVDVVDSPYLEHATHYYPKKKQTIFCSAGPFRKKPCYPCAIESIYWDKFREQEEEVRKMGLEVKIEKNPPIRRSIRAAMAITGVDRYFEVPLTDNQGKVRKNARGEVIKRFVAEPLADFGPGIQFPSKMGHNMHWSYSNHHLSQLERFNDTLAGVCANCCTIMHTSKLICADCGNTEQDFGAIINDLEDLLQLRSEEIQCGSCKSEDVVPVLECSGCGEPAEGGIMDFDLRLKADPTTDKNSDLVLTGWRLPDYDEELTQLYQNPLDVEKICAPMPLNLQKSILGDDVVEGIDPSAGSFTESYGEDSKGEEEDEDIPF